MMCGIWLKYQDQDTGCPDLIFADLFLVMVVDSPAKYTKEITKESPLRAQIQLIHVSVLPKSQSKLISTCS